MELFGKRRGAGTPEVEQATDRVRIRIDQDLELCELVRDGTMVCAGLGVNWEEESMDALVTLENVDEIEGMLRNHFSDRYPDLISS